MSAEWGKRILVVDDSEIVRKAASSVLGEAGYTVDTHASFNGISKAVSSFTPNAVMLDSHLGGFKGEDVIDLIRKNHPSVRVFIYSDRDDIGDIADRYRADGYIKKGPYQELPVRLWVQMVRTSTWQERAGLRDIRV